MTNTKEKYIATLIGCGIGDTLGMPVEMWNREQIKKYLKKVTDIITPFFIRDEKGEVVKEDEFGRLRYWGKDLLKGEYTDDTILTLAIAESIAEKKSLDFEYICKKQAEVYNSLRKPNGNIKGGFGKTTRDAFEKILSGVSPLESGISPGPGTGPCMKMSPIGLYMHATREYDKGIEMSRLISRATHLDERSIASGVAQAHAVFQLLNEPTKQEFLDSIVGACIKNEKKQEYDALPEKGNLASKLIWVKENQDVLDEKAYEYLGSSPLVFEAYPFTIFMFQKYWDKPLKGLIETVNYGGDCDTTGAMFGALAGAKNGMIFPESWVNVLQNKDRLKSAAEGIYNLKS
ncbi:MAG: ADP-ribosylglycohydrolase family protein [Nanoarchaeota archaeon]|nr:ADP-ribosylglycohydrolase family protein [Nanoarchaeota archaeon]